MLLSALAPLAHPSTLLVLGLSIAIEVLTLVLFLVPLRRRLDGLEDLAPDEGISTLSTRINRLENLSYLDPITSLRSGLVFRSELDDLSRRSRSIALLYIDLDDFRRFNQQGHRDVGDVALVLAADVLRKAVRRKADRLYRLHGDEFVVVLPNAGPTVMQECAQRILALLCSLRIQGTPCSATIGGATSELVGWADLELAADLACQRQKTIEKGRYALAPAAPAADVEQPQAAVNGCVPTPILDEPTARIDEQRCAQLPASTVRQ